MAGSAKETRAVCVCVFCGKSYPPRLRVSMYCGKVCGNAATRARKLAAEDPRCVCGEQVGAYSDSGLCAKCARDMSRFKFNPRRPPSIPGRCAHPDCGRSFMASHPCRIYCSKRCKDTALADRYKGIAPAEWALMLTHGRVKLPRVKAAPPGLAPLPAMVDCTSCKGVSCASHHGGRYSILLGRVVHRWRCWLCEKSHQRYRDGAIHEPLSPEWVAARTPSPWPAEVNRPREAATRCR